MKISNLSELIGERVVVTGDHGTIGYMVMDRHLKARRIAATGVVKGWVPGHGGDVVFVEHDKPCGEDQVAVYCHLNELEFETPEAIAFAKDKAVRVRDAAERLKSLSEEPMLRGGGNA